MINFFDFYLEDFGFVVITNTVDISKRCFELITTAMATTIKSYRSSSYLNRYSSYPNLYFSPLSPTSPSKLPYNHSKYSLSYHKEHSYNLQ